MKQMTLATAKRFEVHGRATREAEFLARMEALVPWAQFCALIEPHYPRAGNGRPAMLRDDLRHILQHPNFDRAWLTRPGDIANYCESLPAGIVPGS